MTGELATLETIAANDYKNIDIVRLANRVWT